MMGLGKEQCNGRLRTLDSRNAHIPRGDCGRGRRRGALFSSSLLHKRRANHSCSEQQAVRAASRRAQPTRSTTAKKACRMGLENKKAGRIGKEKPSCDLSEVPEIAVGRHVSTLSTKNRLAPLQELMDVEWEEKMERIAAMVTENAERRRREIRQAAAQEIRALWEEVRETRLAVGALFEKTKRISEQAGKIFKVLGFRVTQKGRKRVVLLGEEEGKKVCVWSTKDLERILESQSEYFVKRKEWDDRTFFWLPKRNTNLRISVQEPKSFWTKEGIKIT